MTIASPTFLAGLPKVELHMHIEGSLEPELMFELGRRNGVAMPFASVEEVREAYRFENLQSFLDIYYQGAAVLLYERDFYDMTWAYLVRCATENVRHAEIFFDPQSHTERGVDLNTVMNGVVRALKDGETQLGVSSALILCFLRHLSAEAAMATLEAAVPYLRHITAVGLDSSELGHPPSKFVSVFRAARKLGLKAVAHAGEEGPAEYIWEALRQLEVSRIDHGVRCVDHPMLVEELAARRVPLTQCPLSNLRLKVYSRMEDHPILRLLEQGLVVTVNSDDPAYFGGYITANFQALADAQNLTEAQAVALTRHAINAAFLPVARREQLLAELAEYAQSV